MAAAVPPALVLPESATSQLRLTKKSGAGLRSRPSPFRLVHLRKEVVYLNFAFRRLNSRLNYLQRHTPFPPHCHFLRSLFMNTGTTGSIGFTRHCRRTCLNTICLALLASAAFGQAGPRIIHELKRDVSRPLA